MTNPRLVGLGGRSVRARGSGCRRAMLAAVGTVMTVGVGGASAQTPPAAEPPNKQPAATPSGEAKGTGVNVREAQVQDDGQSYLVSSFQLEYAPHKITAPLPDLKDAGFQNLRVTLGKTAEGYVRARPGVESVTLRLGDITEGSGGKFFQSAVEAICLAVVAEMNKRGVYAVFVAPDPADIDERSDKDLREGRTVLRLSVYTAMVGSVRTVASGDRDLPGDQIDNPAHKRILRNSPLKKGDLLRKDELDDYLFRLNRHPGRRVDAAIAGMEADEPGAAQVDYLVGEAKPWTVYFQLSNTGTENTNVWRERFGFVHNQVTNNDDIFRIDYSTAGFDASNALLPSYEFPIYKDVLRGRVFGSWSEYTASDVGNNLDTFRGNGWGVGGELVGTVYQRGALFLDLVGGLRLDHYRVLSPLTNTPGSPEEEGEANFLLPSLGVRLSRYTDAASTLIDVGFDFVANDPPEDQVENLGRGTNVDNQWTMLRWDLEQSAFIEPLLIGPRGTPDGKGMTLAHEVSVSFRGQYAFGARVIPNAEAVAGGLYTVRGYPESCVAGDNMYLGSAEYRFHLPNSMSGVQREPGRFMGRDFRWVPQGPYARADWDLIFRGFLDAAFVSQSDNDPQTEPDVTLVGTGLGVELQISRNVDVRLDWGIPLNSVHIPDRDVTAGKSQVHFVLTLAY